MTRSATGVGEVGAQNSARLLDVVEQRVFVNPADRHALLPPGLRESFTTQDLTQAARNPATAGAKNGLLPARDAGDRVGR